MFFSHCMQIFPMEGNHASGAVTGPPRLLENFLQRQGGRCQLGAGGEERGGLAFFTTSLHFLCIFSCTRLKCPPAEAPVKPHVSLLVWPLWPSMPRRLFSHHTVLLPWHSLPKTDLSNSAQATAHVGRNLPTVSPNTSLGPGTVRHR